MRYLVAAKTRLFPHFRTGDFNAISAGIPSRRERWVRYARSVLLAIEDRRVPMARALLVSQNQSWRPSLEAALLLRWVPSLLGDDGVPDARALMTFERNIAEGIGRQTGVIIELPLQHPRHQFKTMKAVADAAYGGARNASVTAWWLW